MPAVSKAQQRFFGMVRATQKGEMASPSSEVSKAASSMSKSDVKKFAKTKHKGLPDKVEEQTRYYRDDPKYQKKLADDDKRHKKQDQRMKFGKFYDKAKEAKERLRPGEVKRYDKKLKKWVSNKD